MRWGSTSTKVAIMWVLTSLLFNVVYLSLWTLAFPFPLFSWDVLHNLCADRERELAEALVKATAFHSNRKAELDWLDGAERNVSATDKVHGLPNTCAKDLEEFEFLQEEVSCHSEPVQALEVEGVGLMPQGNDAEQQQVRNWTDVVKQRWVGPAAVLEGVWANRKLRCGALCFKFALL